MRSSKIWLRNLHHPERRIHHMLMRDFMKAEQAFKKLHTTTRIDPNGACIEMYLNNTDVRCMVKLDSTKKR
jgi:hypothetical protein